MSKETDRFLDEEVTISVVGYTGVGKKSLVSAIRTEWDVFKTLQKRRSCSGGHKELHVRTTTVKSRRGMWLLRDLPACDVVVLVYSMVCEESFSIACSVREQILQKKGNSVPIVFVANKVDLAGKLDKTERTYRDLNISCEWGHGHYEISTRRNTDVEKVLHQILKRANGQ